jgi:2-C-methyl-D-erythritol 4-phosphate cytidylyltransferase
VRRGLAAAPASAGIVVVHDGARPFASPALFRAVVDAVVGGADGAVPALPVTDTVKRVAPGGVVQETLDRAELVTVQTPQAFAAGVLRAAHAAGAEATDDAALVEAAGGRVVAVPGEVGNRKLTLPADLTWAEERVTAGEVAACR